MDKKKIRKIHEFLNKHEWIFIGASELHKHEKCISNSRRVCKQCGKVEWSYGWDEPAINEWFEDRSALAYRAIDYVLEERRMRYDEEDKDNLQS